MRNTNNFLVKAILIVFVMLIASIGYSCMAQPNKDANWSKYPNTATIYNDTYIVVMDSQGFLRYSALNFRSLDSVVNGGGGNSHYWSTTGNLNTTENTNFAGTIDTVNYAIRTANVERIEFDTLGQFYMSDSTNKGKVEMSFRKGLAISSLFNVPSFRCVTQANLLPLVSPPWSVGYKNGLLYNNTQTGVFEWGLNALVIGQNDGIGFAINASMGVENYIFNSTSSGIFLGQQNTIDTTFASVISGGYKCHIGRGGSNFIAGGQKDTISGYTSFSAIVASDQATIIGNPNDFTINQAFIAGSFQSHVKEPHGMALGAYKGYSNTYHEIMMGSVPIPSDTGTCAACWEPEHTLLGLGNRNANDTLTPGNALSIMKNGNIAIGAHFAYPTVGNSAILTIHNEGYVIEDTLLTVLDDNGAVMFKVLNDGRIIMAQHPIYANDAAADLDNNLASGSLYTITGDRAIRQKP